MDFEGPTGRLHEAFTERLAACHCMDVSTRLLQRIPLKEEAAREWVRQFTPLVLLYPQWQAEAFPEAGEETVGRANVAHLFFLVHAFLEDRLLDGQVGLNREEVLFIKQCLLEGQHALDGLTEGDAAAEWGHRLWRDYAQAQLETYTGADAPELDRERVKTIAAGRAAYGGQAVIALAAAGCSEDTVEAVKTAYDATVTGLQWTDDMQDWREDLETGDENLLLVALRQSGLDPYAHPPNDVRAANVAHALRSRSLFQLAEQEARFWFEHALEGQRALGAPTLAALMEKRLEVLPAITRRVDAAAEEEVLVQLLVQSAGRGGEEPPSPEE